MFTRSLRHLLVLSVLPAALAAPSAAAPERPALHFKVFARTGIRLTDVVWTGSRFLYVENTTNAVSAAGPAGTPVRKFASLPKMSEETRCVVSPGGHSFPAHRIYCHTPDNKIYRLSRNGKRVSVLATLPNRSQSDGALAFDTVGRFGYRLVAATGRSGHSKPAGGAVYTIGATGHVRFVGNYAGPGGSDEIAIAPRGFGAVAGWALLGPDPGASNAAIVAINPSGGTRTLAKLPTDPNPIAVIASGRRSAADRRALPGRHKHPHCLLRTRGPTRAVPWRGDHRQRAEGRLLDPAPARKTLPTPQTCERSTARHLQSRSCVVRPRLGTRLSMRTSRGDGVEVAKPLLSSPVAEAVQPDDLKPQATKG